MSLINVPSELHIFKEKAINNRFTSGTCETVLYIYYMEVKEFRFLMRYFQVFVRKFCQMLSPIDVFLRVFGACAFLSHSIA